MNGLVIKVMKKPVAVRVAHQPFATMRVHAKLMGMVFSAHARRDLVVINVKFVTHEVSVENKVKDVTLFIVVINNVCAVRDGQPALMVVTFVMQNIFVHTGSSSMLKYAQLITRLHFCIVKKT